MTTNPAAGAATDPAAVIGPCPTCGDLMHDDGGPVRFEFRTILGRAYYLDYCSHACAEAGRA